MRTNQDAQSGEDQTVSQAELQEVVRWLVPWNRKGEFSDAIIGIAKLWKAGHHQALRHCLDAVTIVVNVLSGGFSINGWRVELTASIYVLRAVVSLHLQNRFGDATLLLGDYLEGWYRITLEQSLDVVLGKANPERAQVMAWVCEEEKEMSV